MTAAFDLRAMGLVLRQGRRLNALSWLLLALAGGWLIVSAARAGDVVRLPWGALLASVGAGLLQLYYAMRVDFDADLLLALADQSDVLAAASGARREAAGVVLDASLQAIGLQSGARAGRNWDARWRGARGLLLRQTAWLVAQVAALAFALSTAWPVVPVA